jgi:transposase
MLCATIMFLRLDSFSRGCPRGGKVLKSLFASNEKVFGRLNASWNLTADAAIFYLTKSGIIWRDLPEGFPPWQTLGNNRRLAKDYERTTLSVQTFLWIAHIRRTLKRIWN